MSTFAERLSEKIKEKGLKQEEVAAGCDCSRWSVSMWCNGHYKPNKTMLEKLSDFLGCTEEYLIYGKDEKEDGADEVKHDEILRNGSGYVDPTAYAVLKKIEKENKYMEAKVGEIWEVEGNTGSEMCVVISVHVNNCTILRLHNEKKNDNDVAVVARGMNYTNPEFITFRLNKAFKAFVKTMPEAEFSKLLKRVKRALGFDDLTDASIPEVKPDSLLDHRLQNENERLKKNLEKAEKEIDDLKCQNQIMEVQKEMMMAAVDQTDGIRIEMAKIEAERDLYKRFYEQMFERVVSK